METISHKMSFAKLYKPWDWIIATGVYLDDMDRTIKKETELMRTTTKNHIIDMLIMALAGVLVSVFIIVIFERRISKLTRTYETGMDLYTTRLLDKKSTRLGRSKNTKRSITDLLKV